MARTAAAWMAILGALLLAEPAGAAFIDFGGFGHGQVMDDELLAAHGLTISAENPHRSFALAAIFDTSRVGTRDADLEGPAGRLWSGGNVAADAVFGNVLIVQENDTGCGDGVCNLPDDEGHADGGDLVFDFDTRIVRFGFDTVDIEAGQAAGARVRFFDDGDEVASVLFGQFACAAGPFCDPTIDFAGDNTANHLPDVTAQALGIAGFDRVVIDLNGSGAVDHLRFGGPQVPEPSPAWLVALALAWIRPHRVRA